MGGHIDVNTSHVITTVLPKTLEPNTTRNPSSAHINIITLPDPVKTEYKYVREFCKELHENHADDTDLFIHLGEARGWTWLTVERAAYKQGMSSNWWSPADQREYYTMRDDANLSVHDIGPCPWDGVPIGLQGALDLDKVVDGASAILKNVYQFGRPGAAIRLREKTAEAEPVAMRTPARYSVPIEVRPHVEGGPYMCGFIHYESLANRYVRKLKRNVLFCHMPGEADHDDLKHTGDGILAIVVAAANEVLLQRRSR